MRELLVTEADKGQRLDKYLKKYMNLASSGFLYKMMRKKNIKLNRQKVTGSELLSAGDTIQLFLAEATIDEFRKMAEVEKAPLPEVVYEDEHILVVNKPAGVLTQKASAGDQSMVEQILYYLYTAGAYTPGENVAKPAPCNRLDRNTSGLLLAGKDTPGLQFLSEILKDRSLHKYYVCVVSGRFTKKQHLKAWLKKDEKTNKVSIQKDHAPGAQPVETEFVPLCVGEHFTLVKVWLITGKSHQIRAHLASIGYPIVGDPKYGDRKVNELAARTYGIHRQLLHAQEIIFPTCQGSFGYLSEQSIRASYPEEFRCLMKGENLHE